MKDAMKTLLILNDPPYGTERTYNGLRLATSLAKRAGEEVRVFLMGDGAGAAKTGQHTPNGYYNLERMIKAAAALGVPFGICGSCMEARGINDNEVVDGSRRSSLEELTTWTQWAERVLVF
jgi:uncharacterized protein involved in oxidation of intracellular sulfur